MEVFYLLCKTKYIIIMKRLLFLVTITIWSAYSFAGDKFTKTNPGETPFKMKSVKTFVFPERSYSIIDFGAKADGSTVCTSAINTAIETCAKAGGGKVIIPEGTWITGAIHFRSNVNLVLDKGAVVSFTDHPQDYLPAVMTSWEGMECYNYSPLVYAYRCKNIAITGEGTLQPQMKTWRTWFARPKAHMDAEAELYRMSSTNVPVVERQMAKGDNNFRPHLIQFNHCKNILLDGFKIRESPFWTIHMLLCDGGVVRNLDVYAHGHNNDGIDLEMSRNFIIHDCVFDQGDDAFVFKSGRNQDAWRLHTPTENIVVRDCVLRKGHCLLGVGSEMSGGVRNVYVHDCEVQDSVINLYYLKTNERRGGYIENIYMKNVKAREMHRMFAIDTDVLYQWNRVPTYAISITPIKNIFMENVHGLRADILYEINGDARMPVENVKLKNITVEKTCKGDNKIVNATNVVVE